MMHKHQRWQLFLALNEWAFALDVATLAALVLLVLCRRQGMVFASWALLAVAAVALRGAVLVHWSYPRKRRMFAYLVRKNRRRLRLESFRSYLDVPCHRSVARAALRELGRGERYREIISRYYRSPWKRLVDLEEPAVFFKTRQEGEQWLRNRKSMMR